MIDGWMDGWVMERWMKGPTGIWEDDGRMDGWMEDGLMDRRMSR